MHRPVIAFLMNENVVLNAEDVVAVIQRLAGEIFHKTGTEPIALVGIQTRGVTLADRLAAELASLGANFVQGTLDISLYRDDLSNLAALPHIESSEIPFDVEGAHIVLCDDVLFTGRTIRAAMNVLLDYGRPACIELAVLADRGRRELPISADYTGVKVETGAEDYLRVHFQETDQEDRVIHYTPEAT
ncbi:bifunctional pyr operon transcriptional regulator/uracil phosphoribosyltransferase PyrR [Kiritimatiellota bacterium B12222]|nr:bifunctional pyr operon transcriptional regulator/uracil phosphoribosyltransferase PyrR [Kiritimatiellota bacterium B12222]